MLESIQLIWFGIWSNKIPKGENAISLVSQQLLINVGTERDPGKRYYTTTIFECFRAKVKGVERAMGWVNAAIFKTLFSLGCVFWGARWFAYRIQSNADILLCSWVSLRLFLNGAKIAVRWLYELVSRTFSDIHRFVLCCGYTSVYSFMYLPNSRISYQ